MLTPDENALLTRTGPGSEMGRYLRRYWTPILLAEELASADGPPVRVKLFGEELIAFRDSNGRLGLLDEYCPHRLTSLFWGRNEECGLRCVYHGWKFDVEGHCVDMPNEPPEYEFKRRVRTTAYPVREWGGLIWAYLGPPEQTPALPEYEWALVPASHRYASKRLQESNYLQAVEGGIDSSHVSFLHSMKHPLGHSSSTLGLTSQYMWRDKSPRFTVKRNGCGLVIGARRDAEADTYYWRITQFLLPTATMIPGALESDSILNGHFWVAIDDSNCWNYSVSWHPDRPLTDAERLDLVSGNTIHTGIDPISFRPYRNRDNNYQIDREQQRTTSFTGITGLSEQDSAVQESMGPVVDRSREHLGTSDTAIIATRRLLLRELRELAKGQEPAAAQNPSVYRVRSASAILPHGVPFDEGARDALLARGEPLSPRPSLPSFAPLQDTRGR
jgi:phthalate 4,5-dioxygenase oxygenase subunit